MPADDHAGTPPAEVATAVTESSPPTDWPELLAGLRAAPDARSRFALLEDLRRVHGAVEAKAGAELLEAIPDGWQRRTALRRLLDTTDTAALAERASTIVASFARRGDRFAAASLLLRHGCTHPDELRRLLGVRDVERLRSRAADRAAGGSAGSVPSTSSIPTGSAAR